MFGVKLFLLLIDRVGQSKISINDTQKQLCAVSNVDANDRAHVRFD